MKDVAAAAALLLSGMAAGSWSVPFNKPAPSYSVSEQVHVFTITNPTTDAQMHFVCAQIEEN